MGTKARYQYFNGAFLLEISSFGRPGKPIRIFRFSLFVRLNSSTNDDFSLLNYLAGEILSRIY